MNAHRKSPKLIVTAALALAAAVCLAAAGIRAGRERVPSRPDTNAHARQSPATSGDASAALRVQTLTLRGGQLRDAGRYQVALPLLQEALALAEGAFGPDSLEAAAVLNQLGMLGKFDGRFDEAEAAYRRALRITEQTVGLEHELAATLLHNLGGLERARGRFKEGEPYARRAVAIRERLVGPDHTETAADVAALAALLDGQGKYEEAERLYLRALAIFGRSLSPSHPKLVTCRENYERLLRKMEVARE